MNHYSPLHVSIIIAGQRCPRQVYYSDPDWGLGYRPRVDNYNILMGNWVHYQQRLVHLEGLDYLPACQRTLARQHELWANWGVTDDYAAEQQLIFYNLMEAHDLWQANNKTHYGNTNLEWVYVEEGFSIPIAGYIFEGQWDGIVRHKQTGELYVFERKTTKRPNEIELGIQWDWQPIAYAWAAEQIIGEPIAGVLYEIIRNCDPTDIKVLKNGLLSKAEDELDRTTYDYYYQTLKEAAGDKWQSVLVDYQKQLNYLRVCPNPVFRRTPVPVSASDVADWPRQFIRKAEKQVQHHSRGEDVEFYLDRHNCYHLCSYRDVCLAQRDGMDWRELLETEFVLRGKERL